MKKAILALASAALLATACTTTGEEVKALKKVVFPGNYPDPSIVRDGK